MSTFRLAGAGDATVALTSYSFLATPEAAQNAKVTAQFSQNNCLAGMGSAFEKGSYFRLIDCCITKL